MFQFGSPFCLVCKVYTQVKEKLWWEHLVSRVERMKRVIGHMFKQTECMAHLWAGYLGGCICNPLSQLHWSRTIFGSRPRVFSVLSARLWEDYHKVHPCPNVHKAKSKTRLSNCTPSITGSKEWNWGRNKEEKRKSQVGEQRNTRMAEVEPMWNNLLPFLICDWFPRSCTLTLKLDKCSTM